MIESLILEIRPGTGGNEASLFASDLYRMYRRFAENHHFKVKPIEELKDEAGLKKVTLEVTGENALQMLKNEAGVHRVQRIPKTERYGRIHSSTATVAILSKNKENEFHLKPEDLKTEFYRAASHGGQNVNKVETAVRIIHLPTGISAASQEERSQYQNREKALSELKRKLQEDKTSQDTKAQVEERRGQIGEAERSEKIRTYNFPQDRVTDHRAGKTFHNIEAIMDGKIEKMIKALNGRLTL